MSHRRTAAALLCFAALLAAPAASAAEPPANASSSPRIVAVHLDAARGAILALRSAVTSDDAVRARRALRRFRTQARLGSRRALAAAHRRANARSAAALADLLDVQTEAARVLADLLADAPTELQSAVAKALRDVLAGATPVSAALGDIADHLPESARVAVAAALAELPLDGIDQLMSDMLAATRSDAITDAVTPILNRAVSALTALLQESAAGADAALAELSLGAVPPSLLHLVQQTQDTVTAAAAHLAEMPAFEGIDLTPLAQAINGLLGTFGDGTTGGVAGSSPPAPASTEGLFSQIVDLLATVVRPPGA